MKTMEQFIDQNRSEIVAGINRSLNHVPKEASCYCPLSRTEHDHQDSKQLDDDDLEDWINNDEGLYSWAISEGVDI